jgi:hypothetical protein
MLVCGICLKLINQIIVDPRKRHQPHFLGHSCQNWEHVVVRRATPKIRLHLAADFGRNASMLCPTKGSYRILQNNVAVTNNETIWWWESTRTTYCIRLKKQRSSGASRRAWNAAKWRHVLFSMVLAVFLCFFHLLVSCHFMFVFLKFWAKFPWHHSFAHVARGYSEMHLFKCWW